MSRLAIALDIGTTNISGSLVDPEAKRRILTLEKPNEQIAYGDDLISRLKHASGSGEGPARLRESLLNSLDSIVHQLISEGMARRRDLARIVAVGNTAMYHLTLSLPAATLARAPFSPLHTELVRKKAGEVGFSDLPSCEFIFLPCVGGFVGSDAIGVMMALRMHKQKGIQLAIDLGTNGEVILGNSEKILVTSTAAGPAFEGWHVSCGSRPVDGAIISYEREGDGINLETIGGVPPTGIASSGLINITSSLIREGRIDSTGRLTPGRFVIYDSGEKEIFINQKDVREIQHAKSAVRTAIKLLREDYGIEYADIDRVAITGKFGGMLLKEDLLRIGIIPEDLEEKKFDFEENLALRGAESVLTGDGMAELDSILETTGHIELHRQAAFQEEFAEGLRFSRALT